MCVRVRVSVCVGVCRCVCVYEQIGAKAEEVALMNGLTVNLHLLLVSVFRLKSTTGIQYNR